MGRIISFAPPSYHSRASSRAASPEQTGLTLDPGMSPSLTIGRLSISSPGSPAIAYHESSSTGFFSSPNETTNSYCATSASTTLSCPGIGRRYIRQQSLSASKQRRLSRANKHVHFYLDGRQPTEVWVADYTYDRTPWVPAHPDAATMRRWAMGIGLLDEDEDEGKPLCDEDVSPGDSGDDLISCSETSSLDGLTIDTTASTLGQTATAATQTDLLHQQPAEDISPRHSKPRRRSRRHARRHSAGPGNGGRVGRYGDEDSPDSPAASTSANGSGSPHRPRRSSVGESHGRRRHPHSHDDLYDDNDDNDPTKIDYQRDDENSDSGSSSDDTAALEAAKRWARRLSC
ncbi:hypothetical protein PYCC9005_004162 [Savitreella phatthalungensis]